MSGFIKINSKRFSRLMAIQKKHGSKPSTNKSVEIRTLFDNALADAWNIETDMELYGAL